MIVFNTKLMESNQQIKESLKNGKKAKAEHCAW